ncbi:DUF2325 domain-containing protein [Thermohalobacter berrensis]|uniref:DUF2325 domain-containing protein n=1 Tax=Thermohalobacter berrensis TaxID=99594 RepID=A0A419T189_9FIRM|nr:DUF2325 domain-containing protein [Thermohalobacter berrensis]RKD31181.1 hypothetical protein BET03_03375 [Thermohalobacter berrensis]
MSVVVLGGHERMEKLYKKVCKKHGCRAKVFTHMKTNLEKRIGCPDCIILFTDVISHKLTNTAMKISKKKDIPKVRLHNSSLNTLEKALKEIKPEN